MSATSRLDFETRVFHDSAKCEEILLRCKYNAEGVANGDRLALVEAGRKSKDQALRAKAHKFPRFIVSQQLLDQYRQEGERVRL